MKAQALAGNTRAQLALAGYRLVDVLERPDVAVYLPAPDDEPPRVA